jgi:hypothetical protein
VTTIESMLRLAQVSVRPVTPGPAAKAVQLALHLSPAPSTRGVALDRLKAPKTDEPLRHRCSEKGCVFPAAEGTDRCLQHHRQLSEPVFYSSHQPSFAVLEQARFGPLRLRWIKGAATTHGIDRRRLAAQRQSFLLGQPR